MKKLYPYPRFVPDKPKCVISLCHLNHLVSSMRDQRSERIFASQKTESYANLVRVVFGAHPCAKSYAN